VEDFVIAKSQTALYKELAGENFKAIRLELYVYLDSVPHVAELIYVSDQYDLAILKINDISDQPFFRIAKTNIIPRQTVVTSLGFPGTSRRSISWEEVQQDQRNDQSGDPRKWYKDNDLQYVATGGEVSKVGNREGLGTVVQHTATIDRGNSGGPLICDDGTVIGINTWGLSGLSEDGVVEGTAVNLSLSIYSVMSEIKRNNIKVSWVEELTSSDE
jgi:S1-C subfamily serine protease